MPYDEFDWFYQEKENLEKAILLCLEDERSRDLMLSSLAKFHINCEYNVHTINSDRSYEDEALTLNKQINRLVFPKIFVMAKERGIIQDDIP